MLVFAFVTLVLTQIIIFEFMLFFCKGKSAFLRIFLSIAFLAVLVTIIYSFTPESERSRPTAIFQYLVLASPYVIPYSIISGYVFNQSDNEAKRMLAYPIAILFTFCYPFLALGVSCFIGNSCL